MTKLSVKKLVFNFIVLACTLSLTAVKPVLAIDYTEDLWDITDQGVFDKHGRQVESISPEPAITPMQTDRANNAATNDSFEAYRETLLNASGGQKAYAEKRLKDIKESLSAEMGNFKNLGDKINATETKLAPMEQEIRTLEDQISIFNDQIRLAREKIQKAEEQIAEKELEMRALTEDLQENQAALRAQENAALGYIALLYEEERRFMDLYSDGTSTFKLLLAGNSVSENLLGRDYVAVMEQTGRQVFHELEAKYRSLEENRAALLLGQKKLDRLYVSLTEEKQVMEETRGSKKDLLEKTQKEKEAYQNALDESIRQQLESALAIQNLKDNMELIESKLQLFDERLHEQTQLHDAASAPSIQLPDNGEAESLNFFNWPVPANFITAYFHDPTYPSRWGIHNAIDIRAPQFTEIRAPANGYVVDAKDNDFGYSYIILAHKKNFVTVYGHVYQILIKPGTLVEKGQVIGLTGGIPGTRGAGLQTTGPHLHFEVHSKGEPQDPLDYLPLYELPIEYVPEKYLR